MERISQLRDLPGKQTATPLSWVRSNGRNLERLREYQQYRNKRHKCSGAKGSAGRTGYNRRCRFCLFRLKISGFTGIAGDGEVEGFSSGDDSDFSGYRFDEAEVQKLCSAIQEEVSEQRERRKNKLVALSS